MVTVLDKNNFASQLHAALDLRGAPRRARAKYLNEALNLGLSDKACKKWLDGETFPTLDKLFAIAKHFSFSIDDLCNTGKIREVNSTKVVETHITYSNDKVELDSDMEKRYINRCINSLDAADPKQKILLDTLINVVRLAFDDNSLVTKDYLDRNPCRRNTTARPFIESGKKKERRSDSIRANKKIV